MACTVTDQNLPRSNCASRLVVPAPSQNQFWLRGRQKVSSDFPSPLIPVVSFRSERSRVLIRRQRTERLAYQ
jgi:hypothetical protein